jgi:hypothetical protein
MRFDFNRMSDRFGIKEGNNAQRHESSIGDETAKTDAVPRCAPQGTIQLFSALPPNVGCLLVIAKRNEFDGQQFQQPPRLRSGQQELPKSRLCEVPEIRFKQLRLVCDLNIQTLRCRLRAINRENRLVRQFVVCPKMKWLQKRRPAIPTIIFISIPVVAFPQESPLALKKGIYVRERMPCKGAPNAAIMSWDGVGFSGAHSSKCTSRVLSRNGQMFQVNTTCSALGDGSPKPQGSGGAESFVLTRLSSTRFEIRKESHDQAAYRWCSANDVDGR